MGRSTSRSPACSAPTRSSPGSTAGSRRWRTPDLDDGEGRARPAAQRLRVLGARLRSRCLDDRAAAAARPAAVRPRRPAVPARAPSQDRDFEDDSTPGRGLPRSASNRDARRHRRLDPLGVRLACFAARRRRRFDQRRPRRRESSACPRRARPWPAGASRPTAAARARTRPSRPRAWARTVSFVGAVGRDEMGDEAEAELAREGIDVSGLARLDEPTGVALIVVDAAGENQIAVASGANAALDADDASRPRSRPPVATRRRRRPTSPARGAARTRRPASTRAAGEASSSSATRSARTWSSRLPAPPRPPAGPSC